MYAIRAFAELAGVTPKALRHYERRGLLAPRRSGAGYRRYTVRDLARLERIASLKALGLSLKQIAMLAGSDTTAIAETLRTHRTQLIEKRRRLDEALAALDAIERDGEPAVALQRFVENAAWTRWEAKRETMASAAPRAPDRASASRLALFREIHAALERDQTGEAARPLAARWEALLDAEACGDAATRAALQKAWASRRIWPDGMRRYVASLYETEPDAWERVAAFLDRVRSKPDPTGVTRSAAPQSDRPAPLSAPGRSRRRKR